MLGLADCVLAFSVEMRPKASNQNLL